MTRVKSSACGATCAATDWAWFAGAPARTQRRADVFRLEGKSLRDIVEELDREFGSDQ